MKVSKQLLNVALLAACGTAGGALAGGLSIGTQSGSGTGNAFAGGAAAAEDASTVWYNPAGMSLLKGSTNVAGALHVLKPSFQFQNNGSTLGAGTGEGGNAGDWAYIPQFYATTRLNDAWSLGAAFNTPFGLKTNYEAGWRGQSIGVESQVKAYNLNLSLAYKVNDMVSVGAGVNYQKVQLKFNSVVPVGTGLIQPNLTDIGTGWNVGVLLQPTAQTRVGAHYRSAINFQTNGDIIAPAALGGNGGGTAGLTTPDTLSVSAFHVLTPQWDLMGDLTWTGWSRLKALPVVRTDGVGGTLTTLSFNWRDTWRTSLGANYKLNDAWKLRAGVAYDKTPTNDVDRTARLPDQDRTWLAFGAQMQVGKSGKLDIGYAHEFIKDAVVNNRSLTGARLIGSFDNKVDILSIQYSHAF